MTAVTFCAGSDLTQWGFAIDLLDDTRLSVRLAVGSLVADVHGVTFPLDALNSALASFVVNQETPVDFTVTLTCGDAVAPPGVARVVSADVDDSARLVTMSLSEWSATFDLDRRLVSAHLGGAWATALETLLKSAVQVFALDARSALFVHGASVARGGAGYVFMGRTGAGKSTAALLSADHGESTLLREEVSCIGGVRACGPLTVSSLPFREKNRRSATAPVSFPLRGLFWLVQADKDSVETLPLSEQVRLLAAATTIGVRDRMFMLPALELAEEVARRVPVRVLKFRKDVTFWSVVDSGM